MLEREEFCVYCAEKDYHRKKTKNAIYEEAYTEKLNAESLQKYTRS